MERKFRLKDRLISLFRRPALFLSVNCGRRRSSRAGKERKSNKVLRVRKDGKPFMSGDSVDQDGRTCPPTSPSSSPSKIYHRTTKQNKMMKKKKTRSKRCELFSTSAMESVDDFGFFSSHEEREEAGKKEDIEAFFSSRGFSSDSSDFYKKAKKMKSFYHRSPLKRREKKSRCLWVNDGFQPLVSISRRKEEKEEEKAGFAVTKKSSDPYGDFQTSMVEMIVERQIFGAGELQWLLNSYLTLNSAQNHPVILKAFVDISQVLFGY